jgi:hypothetical protein
MTFFSVIGAYAVMPHKDASWASGIPPLMKRRDPRIWQMAYTAALHAIETSGVKPASVIVSTALGALDETKNFLDGIYTDGFGSPRSFIASVHNSMGGKLALELKINGPNLTFCDGCNSFASAIATCEILEPEDFPVLAVEVDENIEILDRIIPSLSDSCSLALSENRREGAVALVLEKLRKDGVCIRSSGQFFAGNEDADTAFYHVCKAMLDDKPLISMPPSVNRGAFFSLAEAVWNAIDGKKKGSTVIGAYSPSSKAVSVIEICQ